MAKQPVCPPGSGSKTAGCLFVRLTPKEGWWEKWFCIGIFWRGKEKKAVKNAKPKTNREIGSQVAAG
jgi:hypothetical protein